MAWKAKKIGTNLVDALLLIALAFTHCKCDEMPIFFELGGNDIIGITGDQLSPYFYGSEEDMTVVRF